MILLFHLLAAIAKLLRPGGGNSYNESLSIEDDGFSLFLKPMGMAWMGQDSDKLLTAEGAAEFYWGLFYDRLQ